jgi:saccharopine dehydrogenase-like NADP-dependent oxidoreductase
LKQVLVMGAGKSSPYLISHLLRLADEHDWFITVGDMSLETAIERIDGHPRGSAIRFDVNDADFRTRQIRNSDLVVNMLSPAFQELVAWDCLANGKHMLSVSYRGQGVRDMEQDAQRKGVILLCELGLDPGIDHMSAITMIRRVQGEGGRITSFCSYGSGIPAPEQPHNPLRYVITWNPRNVVMSSEAGAQYMEDGKIKVVPYHHVFHQTWPVQVSGVGELEAYPNRDSLSYMKSFSLKYVTTMIRGTLRYPGWSETWAQIVRLGLPNEALRIPNLAERSYAEVVEMFLPMGAAGRDLPTRVARFLGISPTGKIMENLSWLGLFSDEPTGCQGETSAAMMIDLLSEKLPLAPDHRDMVVLLHKMDVEYPDSDRKPEKITSTMVAKGEPGGFTAMSKTVGLPTAIAAKLILTDQLSLAGTLIPTHPSIYVPILKELAEEGIAFIEEVEVLE